MKIKRHIIDESRLFTDKSISIYSDMIDNVISMLENGEMPNIYATSSTPLMIARTKIIKTEKEFVRAIAKWGRNLGGTSGEMVDL